MLTCYIPEYTFQFSNGKIITLTLWRSTRGGTLFQNFFSPNNIQKILGIPAVFNGDPETVTKLKKIAEERIKYYMGHLKLLFSICCDAEDLENILITNKEDLSSILAAMPAYNIQPIEPPPDLPPTPIHNLYQTICHMLNNATDKGEDKYYDSKLPNVYPANTDELTKPNLISIKLTKATDKLIKSGYCEICNDVDASGGADFFAKICTAAQAAKLLLQQDQPLFGSEPEQPPGEGPEQTDIANPDEINDDKFNTEDRVPENLIELQGGTFTVNICGEKETVTIKTSKNQTDFRIFDKTILKNNIFNFLKDNPNLIKDTLDKFINDINSENNLDNIIEAKLSRTQHNNFINKINKNNTKIGKIYGYSFPSNFPLFEKTNLDTVPDLKTDNKYYLNISSSAQPIKKYIDPKDPKTTNQNKKYPEYLIVSCKNFNIQKEIWLPGSELVNMPLLNYVEPGKPAPKFVVKDISATPTIKLVIGMSGNTEPQFIGTENSNNSLKFATIELNKMLNIPLNSLYIPLDITFKVSGTLVFKPKCYAKDKKNEEGTIVPATEEDKKNCRSKKNDIFYTNEVGVPTQAKTKKLSIGDQTLGTIRVVLKVDGNLEYSIQEDKKTIFRNKSNLTQDQINAASTDLVNNFWFEQIGTTNILPAQTDIQTLFNNKLSIYNKLHESSDIFSASNNNFPGSTQPVGFLRLKDIPNITTQQTTNERGEIIYNFYKDDFQSIINVSKMTMQSINGILALKDKDSALSNTPAVIYYQQICIPSTNPQSARNNDAFVVISGYDSNIVYIRPAPQAFTENIINFQQLITDAYNHSRDMLSRNPDAAKHLSFIETTSNIPNIYTDTKINSSSDISAVYQLKGISDIKSCIFGDNPKFDIFEDETAKLTIDKLNATNQIKIDIDEIKEILNTPLYADDQCCCCKYELIPVHDDMIKFEWTITEVKDGKTQQEFQRQYEGKQPLDQKPFVPPAPQPAPGLGP